MRAVLLLIPLSCALHAQKSTIPVGKSPFEGIDLKMKPIVSSLIVPHFHLTVGSCKDQPDRIYTKSGNTYYACIGGQHWCSQEKGKITPAMISDYEAGMAEFRARIAEFKAGAADRASRHEQIRADMAARRGMSYSARSTTSVPIEAPLGASPSTAPPPAVTAAQIAEITVGASKADVLRILGEPFSRISGEYESLTYLLDNGGTAKFELESQRVTRVQTNP